MSSKKLIQKKQFIYGRKSFKIEDGGIYAIRVLLVLPVHLFLNAGDQSAHENQKHVA
jgi:hypothetical protein